MEDLRRDFRFFFIEDVTVRLERNPAFYQEIMESNHLGHRYILHAFERQNELKDKYPGVVWTGDPLLGSARDLLPLLMRGCHMVSGGAGEGLNLAVAEGAYANLDQDTTMLMGNNAGFTIRMEEVGLSGKGFFPHPKDPANFQRALKEIEHLANHYPGELRSRKARVVNYINTRNDSILTGGEEVLDRR